MSPWGRMMGLWLGQGTEHPKTQPGHVESEHLLGDGTKHYLGLGGMAGVLGWMWWGGRKNPVLVFRLSSVLVFDSVIHKS